MLRWVPQEGGYDTQTTHRGTDHRRAQGRPVGQRGVGALPQTRHLRRTVLQVADELCRPRRERCEEASPAGRRKLAVETDGGGASAGYPRAESHQRKKLVGPKAKRAAAQWSTERFGLSQRRVCLLLALDRNTLRYCSRRPDDAALRTGIREIVEHTRRYGCPRIYVRLRGEGWCVNHKKGDGFIIGTKGCRYGDAGGRNWRPCHASRSRGLLDPDSVRRWILCITGS